MKVRIVKNVRQNTKLCPKLPTRKYTAIKGAILTLTEVLDQFYISADNGNFGSTFLIQKRYSDGFIT